MGVHDEHRKRMRKRFLENELTGFASHEALELLLYYAIPRKDTNALAHELIRRFGSLDGVFSTPVELLQQVEGVGENTAVLLRLAPLIAHMANLEKKERDLILDQTKSTFYYLQELFACERNEAVYELCLDRKYKLLACKRIGEGTASDVNLDVRRLVENALLTSASYVILAHNHPSGMAMPSSNDMAATERALAALKTIGVQLKDHIIIADNDAVSFRDSGYLE